MVPSDRTRAMGTDLNIRKHFFTEGDEHRHRLTREVVESSSLGVFKKPPRYDPGQPALCGLA